MLKKSELLKRALKWISEQRQSSGMSMIDLLDEAGRRFNLSPLQIDTLLRMLKEKDAPKE